MATATTVQAAPLATNNFSWWNIDQSPKQALVHMRDSDQTTVSIVLSESSTYHFSSLVNVYVNETVVIDSSAEPVATSLSHWIVSCTLIGLVVILFGVYLFCRNRPFGELFSQVTGSKLQSTDQKTAALVGKNKSLGKMKEIPPTLIHESSRELALASNDEGSSTGFTVNIGSTCEGSKSKKNETTTTIASLFKSEAPSSNASSKQSAQTDKSTAAKLAKIIKMPKGKADHKQLKKK